MESTLITKKTVVVIGPGGLHGSNGSSVRIKLFLNELLQTGARVIYVNTGQAGRDLRRENNLPFSEGIREIFNRSLRYFQFFSETRIQRTADEMDCDEIFPEDVASDVVRCIEDIEPDWVIINYVFLSKFCILLPKFFCVIDAHDTLARHEVEKSIGLRSNFFCTSQKEERRGLRRASLVIAIKAEEQAFFSAEYDVPCMTIPC